MTNLQSIVTGVLVLLIAQGAVLGQRGDPRPIRPPVIDLDDQTKTRRPGQVMPGDEGDLSDPAPAPAPEPETRTPEPPIPLEFLEPAPEPIEVTPRPEVPVRDRPGSTRAPPPISSVRAGERVSEQEYAKETILGYGPVLAEITRIDGPARRVQWRATSAYDGARGPWHTPRPGERLNGRVEIRTGLGTTVHVRIDEGADVVVERLSRITIEQALMLKAATALSVELRRGRVGIHPIRPNRNGPILLRTPDVATWVQRNLTFDFDAFAGTMRSPLVDY